MMSKLLAILKLPAAFIAIVTSIIVTYNYVEGFREDIMSDNKAVREDISMQIQSINTQLQNMDTRVSEWMDTHEQEQKSFVNSYAKYLSRTPGVTKEFFLEYMEGLEFDLKKKLRNKHIEDSATRRNYIDTVKLKIGVKPQ